MDCEATDKGLKTILDGIYQKLPARRFRTKETSPLFLKVAWGVAAKLSGYTKEIDYDRLFTYSTYYLND